MKRWFWTKAVIAALATAAVLPQTIVCNVPSDVFRDVVYVDDRYCCDDGHYYYEEEEYWDWGWW